MRLWMSDCLVPERVFEYPPKWLQRCLVVTWLVPRETVVISAQVLFPPYNHAPVHSFTLSGKLILLWKYDFIFGSLKVVTRWNNVRHITSKTLSDHYSQRTSFCDEIETAFALQAPSFLSPTFLSVFLCVLSSLIFGCSVLTYVCAWWTGNF